ncbi:hypothetical protein KJV04_004454, partial [Salmonella enterica]|nr:hypothetical protein [Salmonella enterica]
MEIRSIEVVASTWVKKSANAVSPLVYGEKINESIAGTPRQVVGVVGEWKAIKTKMKMKCLDCGEHALQTIDQIIRGHGCKTCTMIELQGKLRHSEDEAITKANEKSKECPVGKKAIRFVGGYKNNSTKNMECECKTHGLYMTNYAVFVSGGSFGCSECGAMRKEKAGKDRKKTTEEALQNLNARAIEKGRGEIINGIIGGVYTDGYDRNVSVKCPIHGDYLTTYNHYMSRPFGCVACANANKGAYRKKTTETALKEAREMAVSRGRGEVVKRFEGGYRGYEDRNLVIECATHGEYVTSLDKFREGCGCTACASWGYDTKRPGYFYIQNLSDRFLKFGITNRSPELRMSQQMSKSKFEHKMILTKYFEVGRDAFELESKIKKLFPTHAV